MQVMNNFTFQKRLLQNQLFIRYLISCILIFLIPCLVICLISYQVFSTIIMDQIMERNILQTEQSVNDLNVLIENMDRTAYQLARNPAVTPGRLSMHVLNRLDIISSINNYILANKYIQDLLLYYPGENAVISSTTYLAPWQVNQVLNLNIDTGTVFSSTFLEDHVGNFVKIGNNLLYVADAQFKNANPFYCLFVIKNQTVIDLFKTRTNNIVLYGKENSALIASSLEEKINAESIKEIMPDMTDKSEIVKLDKSKYFMTTISSFNKKFTVVMLEDTSKVTQPLTQAVSIFTLLLLCVTAITLLFIYVIIRRNYSPIERLKNFAISLLDNKAPQANEIDVVLEAFNSLNSQNQTLSTQYNKSSSNIKGYLINYLIKGEFTTEEQLNSKTSEIGIAIKGAMYYMVLFNFLDKSFNCDEISKKLDSIFLKGIDGFGYNITNNRRVYFIATGRDCCKYKDNLVITEQYLVESAYDNYIISVSSGYEKLAQMKSAFEEILYIISRPDIKAGTCVFYEDIKPFCLANSKLAETGNRTVDEIISYVNHNFSNHNFSVQLLAEEFNTPVSTLSTYFKQKTGHTLIDYIAFLRIEKAKTLLSSTDLTMQELIDSIGYSDVSSFIRKFKKIVGITPGAYRKNYRVGD